MSSSDLIMHTATYVHTQPHALVTHMHMCVCMCVCAHTQLSHMASTFQCPATFTELLALLL